VPVVRPDGATRGIHRLLYSVALTVYEIDYSDVDGKPIYDSKVDATLVWYGAHLRGFKKTHAYAANRSQDTFYNPEGTLAVSVTGSSGRAEENTETYSVVYARFQPDLPEKAIISLNRQKVICQ
jgi:hypothetical protein